MWVDPWIEGFAANKDFPGGADPESQLQNNNYNSYRDNKHQISNGF